MKDLMLIVSSVSKNYTSQYSL